MALKKPVIIVGAGIVGLSLANGLKQAGIPFEVYERDAAIDSRGQGWAITIHWALPYLEKLLAPEVLAAVLETEVDPDVGRNDTGNFLFLNLATLDAKFKIPPAARRRVSRERMRRALWRGVEEHVQWSKRLVDLQTTEDGVTACLEDGTKAHGCLVVGAEGSNSKVRQILRPDAYRNAQLPVRFIGVSMNMSHEQVTPLRRLDPLLFQGSHPDTGVFLWVSMLDVPRIDPTSKSTSQDYRVQVNLSWKVNGPADEVAGDDTQRLQQMKTKACGFHPILKAAIDSIPDGTEVLEIKLADWPCPEWDNQGRYTLVGDAAHAMTMYRGEAANHGILDAFELLQCLQKVHDGSIGHEEALNRYEAKMRERVAPAVQLSREACLEAHDFCSLNEHSAVLRRRAIANV
ncbi:hypothetical protein PRZ48_012690 [Zasmidium cellare]|uniref:FAD-binding domain-containing protein n=1 Tax=Zasmidium cellare TaxID=395010 RepID=A0ABR0E5K5_ZASCE|nr:hypothetical protein PRZ48_012690 [Zasmidium cellare]